MSRDVRHLDYIDALRGYAILAVIAVHTSLTVPALERPLRLISDQGARGVQLFFVVSALTLMLSWKERADGILPFYVRRLFRIAPMFWLAMALFMSLESSGLTVIGWRPRVTTWPNIMATATFMHAFHPQTINNIVPGGWSIGDEMTFYVILPLLVAALRSWRSTAVALVAAIGLSGLVAALAHYGWLFPGEDRALVEQFAFLSFPNQFPSFLMGILVFHLLREFPGSPPPHALGIGLVASILVMLTIPFAAMVLQDRLHHSAYFLPMAYTLPFGVCAWCLAKGGGRFLVNGASRYIGKISYSAYFWHFPVLGLLVYLGLCSSDSPLPGWLQFLGVWIAAVALSATVSTVTYHFVEAPMIRVGRLLAGRVALTRVAIAG